MPDKPYRFDIKVIDEQVKIFDHGVNGAFLTAEDVADVLGDAVRQFADDKEAMPEDVVQWVADKLGLEV